MSKADPAYIPSECLVHLVRTSRDRFAPEDMNALLTNLLKRVLPTLPPEPQGTRPENSHASEARESVLYFLVTSLLSDSEVYNEKLDFFEVRFDRALAKLRATAWKREAVENERAFPLAYEEGDIPHEIEVAALSAIGLSEIDQRASADYRIQLQETIDSLPALQRNILLMLGQGFAVDSQDPKEMTIAKALNKSEKTIRLQRNRARQALEAALREESL